MTTRDKLVVLCLVALLAVTSAGAVVAERGRPPQVAAIGGSYVEGVIGGHRHFTPVLATTGIERDVVRLVFTGLMRADRAGEIVPDLAATYRVEQEGKVWTFEIRDDARWHDGRPVVADDVVYTVSLFQDKGYTGPFAEAFHGVAVDRVGTKVVRFTLPGPYGPFAASTTFPVLPAHRLGGVTFPQLPGEAFDQRPIGTGPFKLSDATPREITLVANPDFYRSKPRSARRCASASCGRRSRPRSTVAASSPWRSTAGVASRIRSYRGRRGRTRRT